MIIWFISRITQILKTSFFSPKNFSHMMVVIADWHLYFTSYRQYLAKKLGDADVPSFSPFEICVSSDHPIFTKRSWRAGMISSSTTQSPPNSEHKMLAESRCSNCIWKSDFDPWTLCSRYPLSSPQRIDDTCWNGQRPITGLRLWLYSSPIANTRINWPW